MKMNITWDQVLNREKEIIKDHRRRRGLLMMEQLEMINHYENEIINSNRKLS